jgi:hypothetical protein
MEHASITVGHATIVSVLSHVPLNMSQSLLVMPLLFHCCLNTVRCDSAHLTTNVLSVQLDSHNLLCYRYYYWCTVPTSSQPGCKNA